MIRATSNEWVILESYGGGRGIRQMEREIWPLRHCNPVTWKDPINSRIPKFYNLTYSMSICVYVSQEESVFPLSLLLRDALNASPFTNLSLYPSSSTTSWRKKLITFGYSNPAHPVMKKLNHKQCKSSNLLLRQPWLESIFPASQPRSSQITMGWHGHERVFMCAWKMYVWMRMWVWFKGVKVDLYHFSHESVCPGRGEATGQAKLAHRGECL